MFSHLRFSVLILALFCVSILIVFRSRLEAASGKSKQSISALFGKYEECRSLEPPTLSQGSEARTLLNGCLSGDGEHCRKLAVIFYNGENVEKNYFYMACFERISCEKENGLGCFYLGNSYKGGNGNCSVDLDKMRIYYKKSIPNLSQQCFSGRTEGCSAFMELYKEGYGGNSSDFERMQYALSERCDTNNDFESCYYLAIQYLIDTLKIADLYNADKKHISNDGGNDINARKEIHEQYVPKIITKLAIVKALLKKACINNYKDSCESIGKLDGINSTIIKIRTELYSEIHRREVKVNESANAEAKRATAEYNEREMKCSEAEDDYRTASAALGVVKSGKTFSDYHSSRQSNPWNALAGFAAGSFAQGVAQTEVDIAYEKMRQVCAGLR